MKILLYRLLDYSGSAWRRFWKVRQLKKRWGNRWSDMSRSGRKYTRVEPINLPYIPQGEFANGAHQLRPEPGWEWTCQNCKAYSMVTESMMPAILAEWRELANKAVTRGYKAPPQPTAATAGCPECKFRPGDPE